METPANSTSDQFLHCISDEKTMINFTSWFIVYLLFLPIFLFVFYFGFKKWKKQRSSTTGNISHSDVFTFHMTVMEMTSIVGTCVVLYGFSREDEKAVNVGGNMVVTTTTGQVFFHSLTCVERYLAVVHPVTYMSLRKRSGVTIRNTSVGFVWAFSFMYTFVFGYFKDEILAVSGFVLSLVNVPLVAFCSISVLCVLIRPKPGEGAGNRKQIDQSKRNTFYTMLAILGALLMRLIVLVIYYAISFTEWFSVYVCSLTMASLWFSLPSSLVLPLLFLHRTGKLPGYMTKAVSKTTS